jgi:transglutaminase-like putative cysteine protease
MSAPAQVRPRPPAAEPGSTRRTLRALLASALGVLPLCELFTDVRWVFEIWVAMLVTIAPAAILRSRRAPRVWHTWLGLLLVVLWLTAKYLPDHALGGLLPTVGSWHDIGTLLTQLHDTTRNGVAPVHTTLAIKFVLAAVLSLLAALVDFIAVVGRRGALAGVPLLVVYTVSGAVPRHPVAWLYFAGAAIGFLLLLSIDADDEMRSWGRLIPRTGDARQTPGLVVSGPRIAAIALATAVILPLFAPSSPTNLIADAFHNNSGGGGGGLGGGFGAGGISLDPFDALKGDLQRAKPVNLFTVTLAGASATEPGYLRANVLSNYTDKGWSVLRHGGRESVADTGFQTEPEMPLRPTVNYTARIAISGLSDNPPIFGKPVAVDGVDSSTNWSTEDELLVGSRVRHDQQFVEQVAQPAPTIAELRATGTDYPPGVQVARQVPTAMPKMVTALVARLTRGLTSPYDKARALHNYFTDPVNGFTYSLATKAGDSGSDLVDFLTNKVGFCQQYAAAMGIMLRMAGLPARVVLGYTHPPADRAGRFTVTTNDAHSWVEVYFPGQGWIPFDPTPLAGIDGGSRADLPWAPHPRSQQGNGQDVPTVHRSVNPRATVRGSTASGADSSAGQHGAPLVTEPVLWAGLVLVFGALLALIPAGTRWQRRRRRLRAAVDGDPDPLWAELSATAVDLGYVWSPARTPRQVAGWLGRQIDPPAQRSLATLASAVEVSRYAPIGRRTDPGELIDELRTVEARLRAERSRSVRVAARLVPASLGWRRVRITLPRRRRR